jgi:hypothetical protein
LDNMVFLFSFQFILFISVSWAGGGRRWTNISISLSHLLAIYSLEVWNIN